MSWTQELYKVYERYYGLDDGEKLLLPVSHAVRNAQIEISISQEGCFASARKIDDKIEGQTVIPVTEDSGTRSSGIAPHPLEDKLFYIAGDYKQYAAGKKADNTTAYESYLDQLAKWKNSSHSCLAVEAVYNYLSKGTVISDLIQASVLVLDEKTGKLKETEKIQGIAQEDSFVRFRVEYEDLFLESRLWKDSELYQKFIDFYAEQAGEKQLCYATGEIVPCTYKHPAQIRNSGDKAKLISANDESGFSYRGRFSTKREAISVSYDFSQKIHNALKWLIEKQGLNIDSMVLIIWETSLKPLPNILEASENLRMPQNESEEQNSEDDIEDLEDLEDEQSEKASTLDTVPAYKKWLRQAIWGQVSELSENSKSMILALDAATMGRLSISVYEEMATSELYRNMEIWHSDSAWLRFNWKEKKRYIKSFSLYEIADYAFGTEQGSKVECKNEFRKSVILRLIPCVTEKRDIPADIVANLVRRASRPLAYHKTYNWMNVLEAACGMIRKSMLEQQRKRKEKEDVPVALDHECRQRDYLYGRLLAVAEAAERATYEENETRVTNACRYFETFSNRPYQTWNVIYSRLRPYLNRMKPGQRVFFEKMVSEISDKFTTEDYCCNDKLKPEYLLAYYCQLNEIYTKKEDK